MSSDTNDTNDTNDAEIECDLAVLGSGPGGYSAAFRGADLGLKTGQLFAILRVAITGRTVAPPLFETLEVLGRDRALERMDRALERLEPGG